MATQLQVISSYTLLQSTISLPNLCQQAREQGYQALALTDINVTYGLVDFYRLAKKYHLQPILGLTLEVAGLINPAQQYPLLLLARNDRGYHNLLQLSTLVMTSSESLEISDYPQFLKDLIVIAPDQGELQTCLKMTPEIVQKWVQQFQNLPGDDLYLGVSIRDHHQVQAQTIAQLAKLHDLPVVALGDVQYLTPKAAFATEVLRQIGAGGKIESYQARGDHYLQSLAEFTETFQAAGLEEALENTDRIAAQCQVEINFQRTQLPKYPTPEEFNAQTYLQHLARRGLTQRFSQQVPGVYQERLEHELKIIAQMGYDDYFLIVWDAVRQAHHLKILTGPGRGSAAGSLVSYALGITQVDPLKYDLLFERFLNPERVDMPDIDLDIPDDRRDELVRYLHQKYGAHHMAQIITFGTFGAKQALRDVGRVLACSSSELGRWSKAIPAQLGISLKEAYQNSPALQNLYRASRRNQLLFQTALQLENLPRHFSTHAAGVVLGQQNLEETVALQKGSSEQVYLTQQPKGNIEALGLLKIDFLGLKNLTILNTTLHLVDPQKPAQEQLNQIPLDDAATLKLFQVGDTEGIFQFESAGIRSVLRRMQPTSFLDIVAANALYRPGPMENIGHYIQRKHQQEAISYPDPSLEPILQPTYGILVYQEQVMQVVSQMAGFSLAAADLLRRAVSKKDRTIMEQQKATFIQQAVARGHRKENAQQVFRYIEQFANYGFNKSHAVAYSQLAYDLAYLKVHFPRAFFVALLNANANNDAKVVKYFQALKLRQIKILRPDLNRSDPYFRIEKANLRTGFFFIKGLRRDLVKNILEMRQQGSFSDLANFLRRLETRFLKKDFLLPLIYSGALDGFNKNRHQLTVDLEGLIESLSLAGQSVALFDVLAPKSQKVPDYSATERLEQEQKYLGAYVSGHPVDYYYKRIFQPQFQRALSLKLGDVGTILYFVKKIKVIRTKNGSQMAFIEGGDELGDYNLTIFPSLYQRVQLEEQQVYVIQVKVSLNQRQQPELVAEKLVAAQQVLQEQPQHRLFIRIMKQNSQILQQLLALTLKFSGPIPVVVYFADSDEKFLLKKQNWVQDNSQFRIQLQQLVGTDNFVYN
ncbi:DNA polymerase III subunit alpha [Lactobacillus sp. DCY120]|uniref:DNA-directed DNA polymerase n=1 Tax=Bombilactobacillus apium TaxID=2675299 RepID=A0A850R5C7_9LACO|nr:DNA polymerase III subunit alpha [Bombilactobacillus apium]NVY95745.1 DNA polymerase III subunit alpha [Bombilactobacillus apium]